MTETQNGTEGELIRSGVVNFSVTGEFLTENARNLVLSGEYDRAENSLLEGLVGISHELVHQVLSGEKRLIGVNDIDLENDPDSQGYRDQVNYTYSGRCRLQYQNFYSWWRPVAYWKWTPKAMSDCNYEITIREGELPRPVELQKSWHMWIQRAGLNHGEVLRRLFWEGGHPEAFTAEAFTEANGFDSYCRQFSKTMGVYVFFESCDAPPPWMREKALSQNLFCSFIDAIKAGRVRPREFYGEVFRPPPRGFEVNREPPSRELPPSQVAPRKELWPIWDGTGAFPAQAPIPRIPSLEEGLDLINQEIAEEQKEHAREQIHRQAEDSGWMGFPWREKTVRVPKGAFECWALRRTLRWEEATPWKIMSGEAWKQLGDDPYHTDWMIGAGLELSLWDDKENGLVEAAYDAMHALQSSGDPEGGEEAEALTGTVLVALSHTVDGEVIHPKPNKVWYKGGEHKVVVLPNLSPKYAQALMGASLVISQVGGAYAHLSQLGTEKGIPILRLKNALTELPEGTLVRVRAGSGEVKIVYPYVNSSNRD